jgi:uncharacterized protein
MNLPTRQECFNMFKEFDLPQNIINHCLIVNKISVFLAKKLIEKGENINLDLLDKASLLHDLDKMLTLKSVEHGKKSQEILTKKGYPEIGHLVNMHTFKYLIDNSFQTIEEKIINYADKRVKHEKIVSLKERFDDLANRYDDISGKRHIGEKNCYLIEQEIFFKINIKPEDLKEETQKLN